MAVGVLALQGDFSAHQRILSALGTEARAVRRPGEIRELDGLVIPGGESTTLLRLMANDPPWWTELETFYREGKTLFGTCAGLILLAREVTPAQRSLNLIDVAVRRNAYGRQVDSFETRGAWHDGRPLEMVFIRAPRITRVGPEVTVLARHHGEPVLVEQGQVLTASFHPELTGDGAVHRHFLALAEARVANRI